MAFTSSREQQSLQTAPRLTKFTSKELLGLLLSYGYRYCVPKASTWHSALIYKHFDSVLCVMFRKNGVDLRYYDFYSGKISIDSNNIVSFIGGDIYRNCYDKSFQINRRILAVAEQFARGKLKRNDIPGKWKSTHADKTNAVEQAPSQSGLHTDHCFL